jgi:hypothetical protein
LDKPFKIVQMLSSGKAKIGVASSKEKSLKELISGDPEKFPLIFDENEGEAIVSNTSHVYCTGCSYLIAVISKSGAKGELFIDDLEARVPLSINGLLKEKITIK